MWKGWGIKQEAVCRWKGGKAETAEKATHGSDTEDEEAMDASSESGAARSTYLNTTLLSSTFSSCSSAA